MNILKSIGAVIAGFLTIIILASTADAMLAKTGVFPAKPDDYTSGLLPIALAYPTVFALLAGMVIARLAPKLPALAFNYAYFPDISRYLVRRQTDGW